MLDIQIYINLKAGTDMFRTFDKIRYLVGDFKNLFKKHGIFVNIKNQKCRVLGRVGTYHITVDITGKNIKIGDEVVFNTSIKYVNSSIKREYI